MRNTCDQIIAEARRLVSSSDFHCCLDSNNLASRWGSTALVGHSSASLLDLYTKLAGQGKLIVLVDSSLAGQGKLIVLFDSSPRRL